MTTEKVRQVVFAILAISGVGLLLLILISTTPAADRPDGFGKSMIINTFADLILAVPLLFIVAMGVGRITGAAFGALVTTALGLLAAYYFPVAVGLAIGVFTFTILGAIVFLVAEFVLFRWAWGFGGFETTISVLFVSVARVLGAIGLILAARFLHPS